MAECNDGFALDYLIQTFTSNLCYLEEATKEVLMQAGERERFLRDVIIFPYYI